MGSAIFDAMYYILAADAEVEEDNGDAVPRCLDRCSELQC